MSASVFSPSSSWSCLHESNAYPMFIHLDSRLATDKTLVFFLVLLFSGLCVVMGRFLAVAESMTTQTVVRVHRACPHPVSKPSRTHIQRHLTSRPQDCSGNSDHKLQYIMQHTACWRQWRDMCVGSFCLVLNAQVWKYLNTWNECLFFHKSCPKFL